jgi:hypothetical protein
MSKSSTKEIAAFIRADVKAAQKARTLPAGKISVCMRSFSGGSAIDVRVVSLPVVMFNKHRHAAIAKHRDFYSRPEFHSLPVYTPEGQRIMNVLNAIVSKYHVDKSDTMSDYFDVNFYKSVEAHEQERNERSDAKDPLAVAFGILLPVEENMPAPVESNQHEGNEPSTNAANSGTEPTMTTTTNKKIEVSVFGPNLSGGAQSLGNFHVHAAGCDHSRHYGFGKKYGGDRDSMDFAVVSREHLVRIVHDDIIRDGATIDECMGEYHFANCVYSLPLKAPAAKPVLALVEDDGIESEETEDGDIPGTGEVAPVTKGLPVTVEDAIEVLCDFASTEEQIAQALSVMA